MTTISPGELVTAAQINSWCPPGIVSDFAGAAAPTGWLLCDGASYLRSDYPELFTNLGGVSSPWGLPDGTHFNVPDLRGRVSVGLGTHADVSTLANNEGSTVANRRPKHPHAVANGLTLPDHVHSATTDALKEKVADNSDPVNKGTDHADFTPGSVTVGNPTSNPAIGGTLTVGPAGTANDAPAYAVINKIIRAKD